MTRNRIAGVALATTMAIGLTSCDFANQMIGPGGFRVVDNAPEFIVCGDGVVTELHSTAYSGDTVVVWSAKGARNTSSGDVLDQVPMRAEFESFDEVAMPTLLEGDHVSLAIKLSSGVSSVITFYVSDDALSGEWVVADGSPSEAPCERSTAHR